MHWSSRYPSTSLTRFHLTFQSSRPPEPVVTCCCRVRSFPYSMSTPAIRFVAARGPKGQTLATIQLLCHVKPGVSANREGIGSVSDESIQVCVAAQAREGEANKAVREVIADALKVPKSDVDIAKGMKSREKAVAVNLTNTIGTPEEEVERIRGLLLGSVSR